MQSKLIFLLLFIVFCSQGLTAQKNDKKITIEGTVLDSNGAPVPNAIIMVDGARSNAITNSKGNYRIKVTESDTTIGVFTFSCGVHEESIYGRTKIDFNLSTVPDSDQEERSSGISIARGKEFKPGEESVDVGYAHMKKKDLTTDISFIDGTNKKYESYGSVIEMIVREVSGVRQVGDKIIIQETVNMSGSVGALIIIDGASGGSLSDVQPSHVESISVLKGTSAAIYGVRGYGGVIIIKTKL
jgi:TonB-dependent SusC/RagA subfamily outer membrane receptor